MQKDKALVFMFENFPHTNVTEAMFQGFQQVCDKSTIEAVQKTCDDFAFGRVDSHNRDFLPTLAAFTDRLERTQADLIRQRHMASKMLKHAPSPPPTDEQKRKVRMLQATFHATQANEEFRAKKKKIPESVLRSKSYRNRAKEEFAVEMRHGWPVYVNSGEGVLDDDTKAEYKLGAT